MNWVAYLVTHPEGERGLVFPREHGEADIAAPGSFFLMGAPRSKPELKYSIPAVHGDKLVSVTLYRDPRSRSFYHAKVPGVGEFLFHAEVIKTKLPYLGAANDFSQLVAIRRLRSWRHGEFDRACREHGFYFVGYAPGLDVPA